MIQNDKDKKMVPKKNRQTKKEMNLEIKLSRDEYRNWVHDQVSKKIMQGILMVFSLGVVAITIFLFGIYKKTLINEIREGLLEDITEQAALAVANEENLAHELMDNLLDESYIPKNSGLNFPDALAKKVAEKPRTSS